MRVSLHPPIGNPKRVCNYEKYFNETKTDGIHLIQHLKNDDIEKIELLNNKKVDEFALNDEKTLRQHYK